MVGGNEKLTPSNFFSPLLFFISFLIILPLGRTIISSSIKQRTYVLMCYDISDSK